MEDRIARAVAVEAISAWMAVALRAHAPSSQSSASSGSVLAITHTTAALLAAEWIQEGLVHLQQQPQREPQEPEPQTFDRHFPEHRSAETLEDALRGDCSSREQEFDDAPSAEFGVEQEKQEQYVAGDTSVTDTATDCADCSSHDQKPDEPSPLAHTMTLEIIQSISHSVVSTATLHALAQLLAPRNLNRNGDNTSTDPVDLESMATEYSASKGSSPRPSTTAKTTVTPPDVPVLSIPHVATWANESLSLVARQFVQTLLGEAVHHHNTAITTPTTIVVEEPAPPPSLSPVDSVPTHGTPSPPPPASDAPPLPRDSDLPTPSVVLAAVKPPKQVSRHPQRKPIESPTESSSPRLAPVQPPPKTADHHHHHHHHQLHQLRDFGGRTPRTSPRPVFHDHELFPQSPPRLRKLEEYLELHPVDRAKRVYRPRRPRHERHPPMGSHTSVHGSPRGATGGYDADQEGTHDDTGDTDDVVLAPPPPRVKLAPLRVAAVYPQLPLPTASGESSHTTTLVDRPGRLGLLNKPKKRSGFCQQCGFEGRSCKVSDCLKHQPLR
jgi:hypothetical protein